MNIFILQLQIRIHLQPCCGGAIQGPGDVARGRQSQRQDLYGTPVCMEHIRCKEKCRSTQRDCRHGVAKISLSQER